MTTVRIPPGTVISFGNDNVANTTTTRFLDRWSQGDTAPTVAVPFASPRPGRIRNFTARQEGSANGNPVVYTLLVNGSPTALSLSLSTAAPITLVDTVNAVTIAQGDLITVRVTKALNIGGGLDECSCSMELV